MLPEPNPLQDLHSKIHTIRGQQVILDKDLADLYGTTPIRLRQQVKRNPERFPADFMFQITEIEVKSMVSQNVIPSRSYLGGTRPYAFTEQGIASLSGVLTTPIAVQAYVGIMRAFVAMRRTLIYHPGIIQRMDFIERRQSIQENETSHHFKQVNQQFEQVFTALESPDYRPQQGIYFDGQSYDAHVFVSDLIRSAKKSIVLIDNYVDDTVLTLLSKRPDGVSATLFTKSITKTLELDLAKHNAQYPAIEIREFSDAHDRFLILDGQTVYHIGASLKDLGKKWFAFSRFDKEAFGMLNRLT